MSIDPFSDVLRLTDAKSIVSGGFSVGGTWGLKFPPPGELVFAAIAQGTCWLRLGANKKAMRFDQGDVALLTGKLGFILGSSPTSHAGSADVVLTNETGRLAKLTREVDCTVLAGRVSLHPSSAALLTDVLPSMVSVQSGSPRAAPIRLLLEQLIEERNSIVPGTDVAIERIAELLFIQILRAHLSSEASLPSGWLRAVRDERILKALRLMHDKPGYDWKLEALASAAGMSRTRFAVHFKDIAGVAPLTYLTEWRMRLAQRSLREDTVTIAQLADSLGYTSESAFSNAFKRVTGTAPRNYRKDQQLERLRKYSSA